MSKVAILACFALLLVKCENKPDIVHSFSISEGDYNYKDPSSELVIEVNGGDGDLIVSNHKDSFRLIGAISLPSTVSFYPSDEITIVQNGNGSGQMSYLRVYKRDVEMHFGQYKIINKYIRESGCNLSSDFVSGNIEKKVGSVLYVNYSILDRDGVCEKSKIRRVKILFD